MRIMSLFRRLAAMGIVAMAANSTYAQEYYPGEQTVTVSTANLDALMRRIDVLEAQINQQVGKGLGAGLPGGKGDGLGLGKGAVNTHDEGWTLDLGGRVFGDYVAFIDQNAGSLAEAGDVGNYFEFRQLRLDVTGEGYGVYDFKIQFDFEPEGDGSNGIDDPYVAMKDIYFGIHELPVLGYLRFGHYKAPFSLEELTSARYITFMERSLANTFSPSREVGVTMYQVGQDLNWTFAYGVFFDDVNEGYKQTTNIPAGGFAGLDPAVGTDDDHGVMHAARMTYLPYYDEPSDGRYLVHTGLSYRYTHTRDHDGDGIGDYRFRARPEIHEGPRFIDTGTIDGNSFQVADLEMATVWGPASLQSEIMYVRGNDPAGGAHEFYAAYLQGSYFLTGESRPYDRSQGVFTRVRPYENFWIIPGCVGSGAVELTARWSYLDLQGTGDDESGLQHNATAGVNWYWNPNMRWMVNYIHSWNVYDNGDPTAENDIIALRGQVDF